ncbi:MAG: hypothetical protein JSS38_07845 [Nitrospira sp.]|nr:hypothetical protein [Nitrospira sp.]
MWGKRIAQGGLSDEVLTDTSQKECFSILWLLNPDYYLSPCIAVDRLNFSHGLFAPKQKTLPICCSPRAKQKTSIRITRPVSYV